MCSRASWTFCLACLTCALALGILNPGRGDVSDWNVSLLILGALGIAFASVGYPLGSALPLSQITLWAVLLFPAYVALQILPLPLSIVRFISPARAQITEALGAVLPLPRFTPLSIVPANTLIQLARVCGYIVTFLLVRQLTRVFAQRVWLPAMPLMLIGVVEAAWGLAQDVKGGQAISGTYLDRDLFAGFLEMILPLLLLYGLAILYESRKRGSFAAVAALNSCAVWLAGAAVFAAIVLSFSKMGLVSTLGSLFMMGAIGFASKASGWKKWPALAAFTLVLFALSIFLIPNELIEQFGAAAFDKTLEGRWPIWKDTLHLVAAYPLFGCGLGNFSSAFPKYETAGLNVGWGWAHNDYLQLLSELGIVGVLILAGFVVSIFVHALSAARSASSHNIRFLGLACAGSLAAILSHSATDFNMYIPANAMVLSWIAGIASGVRNPAGRYKRYYSTPSLSFTTKFVFAVGSVASTYAAARLVANYIVPTDPEIERAFCRFDICDTDAAVLALQTASGAITIPSLHDAALLDFVRRDPAAPASWCDLGEAFERAGKTESARHCFSNALALGPHLPYIFFRVGTFYLDRREITKGLDLTAKGLETDPASADAMFADYEERKIPAIEVLHHALQNRGLYQAYLRFLVAGKKTADAEEAWNWVLSRNYADNKLANDYVQFLVGKKEYESAQQAWARYACDRDKAYPESNRVFNGGFESEPTGSPFDWTVEQTPGANIDFDREVHYSGSRSLRIEFDGTQNLSKIGLSQTVFLKSGRYRFAAYVRAREISTDEGVAFRVANEEAANRLSFTTKAVLGSTDWTLVEHPFTVPPTGAGLINVRLIRTPSLRFDNLIRGTLWIDQVSISREPTTEQAATANK